MNKYTVPCLILKINFPEHNKYKEQVLKLIEESDDKGWFNQKNDYNDKIYKTDWPIADNWERPYIKLIGDSLHNSLTNCAQNLGFRSIEISKIWYQQYIEGNMHNWHTHYGNYTGTYYIEFDESNPTTEFIYPNDLNKSFTIKVKEGDLLFFPCFLKHRSSISKSKKRKSIISWNCDFNRIQSKFTGDRKNIDILKEAE